MENVDLQARFDRLLEMERFDEAEELLRQSVERVPEEERRNAFSTPVRIRRDIAAEAETEEEGFLLDLANTMARNLRNARYQLKIASGYSGLRVLDEGDSWYQYPVLLEDIIDVVSRDHAVFSLSGAGDTLEEMAGTADYRQAIAEHHPDIFIISAGGNDVLGEGAFINLLKRYRPGATARELLDTDRLARILSRIASLFDEIFRTALTIKPSLRIVTHGYDYIHPREGGKWIGRPLESKGIPFDIGREIVKVIINDFNVMMEELAGRYSGSVTHVNLLGKVDRGAQSWYDEIHPKNAGFERAAIEIGRQFAAAGPDMGAVSEEAMLTEALRPLLGRVLRTGTTELPSASPTSVLDKFLGEARTRQRKEKERLTEIRQRELDSDPEYREALAHIAKLLADIEQPESEDRRKARNEYLLYGSRSYDERTIGKNNLDQFYVLSRGALVGASVGKVFIRLPEGSVTGSGTGFLVGPGLLLTNNHVLEDRGVASASMVAFNHELDVQGEPRRSIFFRLTGEPYFTSKELDFSLVGVEPVSIDGGEGLKSFGHIPMLPRSGKALKMEYVNIIQHPNGDYKKVALRENVVIGHKGDFLYYVTDTEPGSSGAPVHNEEWQLAALHHRTVPDPENPSSFIANRGVRISSICGHVRAAAESGDRDAMECWRRIQIGLNSGLGGVADESQQIRSLEGGGWVSSRTPIRESLCTADCRNEALALYEASGEWTPQQARAVLSDTGYRLILEHETGGPGYYNQVLKQAPTWPKGKSGVTIGVGYDLGYRSFAQFRSDWSPHLGQAHFERLAKAIGVRGTAAQGLAASMVDIKIPLETAGEVFDIHTLPEYVALTYKNLPKPALDALHPHCVSALVSLVFNRGASFRKVGDRYREMRAILAAMQAMDFAAIPDQIRSMKRLWINTGQNGLLRRRDDEANLFRSGLDIMNGESNWYAEDTVATVDAAEDYAEEIDREGDVNQTPVRAFEVAMPHLAVSDARWVSSTRNQPDQWHLPAETADDVFELDASLINTAISAGAYHPHQGPHGKLIISLRGCQFAGNVSSVEDVRAVSLRAASPDHENYRCLIGVFDTLSERISLYLGSTVPRRSGMLGYYNRFNFDHKNRLCNLLPTGLYEHCVGTHYSVKLGPVEYVLRLGDGPEPANAGKATVLRTRNDLVYGIADFWDETVPADNIHPAFSTSSFSSLGCLTVRGSQKPNQPYTSASGEWAAFRRKAGFDGRNHGVRYDNLLVTGHELASHAALAATGANALRCLRHGSQGDQVQRLQKQLGVATDGRFGAATRKALALLQMERLGYASGSWTREMASLLGMEF